MAGMDGVIEDAFEAHTLQIGHRRSPERLAATRSEVQVVKIEIHRHFTTSGDVSLFVHLAVLTEVRYFGRLFPRLGERERKKKCAVAYARCTSVMS